MQYHLCIGVGGCYVMSPTAGILKKTIALQDMQTNLIKTGDVSLQLHMNTIIPHTFTTHNTQHSPHNTHHTPHTTTTQHITHNTEHTPHTTQHITHNTQHTPHTTHHYHNT